MPESIHINDSILSILIRIHDIYWDTEMGYFYEFVAKNLCWNYILKLHSERAK